MWINNKERLYIGESLGSKLMGTTVNLNNDDITLQYFLVNDSVGLDRLKERWIVKTICKVLENFNNNVDK